jgi:hypothetical protein
MNISSGAFLIGSLESHLTMPVTTSEAVKQLVTQVETLTFSILDCLVTF